MRQNVKMCTFLLRANPAFILRRTGESKIIKLDINMTSVLDKALKHLCICRHSNQGIDTEQVYTYRIRINEMTGMETGQKPKKNQPYGDYCCGNHKGESVPLNLTLPSLIYHDDHYLDLFHQNLYRNFSSKKHVQFIDR